ALLKSQKDKEAELAKEREEFEETKKQETEKFQEQLDKRSKEAEREIEKKLKAKLLADNDARIKEMQQELAEKSDRVKDLIKKEVLIEKLKREKEEAGELAK